MILVESEGRPALRASVILVLDFAAQEKIMMALLRDEAIISIALGAFHI